MDDLTRLPPREADSHKGTYGRVLLIGGSRGMAGSISLAGMAALRSGAGLVTLAVPDDCLDTVAGFHPCYMTIPLPADADGELAFDVRDLLSDPLQSANAVAVGPGFGDRDSVRAFVLELYRSHKGPLVVDADGLNALACHRDQLPQVAGVRVFTPHPREFARLTGEHPQSAEAEEQAGLQFAAPIRDSVLVLKGHRTLVTDGQQVWRNQTGNPGMATGGCGDVLTGMIAALLGQGLSAWDAARYAVRLHGLAGDIAAAELGQISLTAIDLLTFLPTAIQQEQAR
ncbi:NAD(P)H-hydrate dehydratase [Lignipirellula cremea]|uniref:ADP-dependent (S)-NAD(P)H-hydrate dehydratase n=1 Tax=Lignipirellula cremea TaxID=2528010 RepID=A0A518DUW3_9BACT|nr:NAD(P)H-hydrate dehydratase [Lignipirellula cremea]QDU95632.1 ATP-dependent (S)-NAD(P)H-hydrate dehydratase [Lignipirellula cremea]